MAFYKKIASFIRALYSWVIYGFSICIPKNVSVWVFIGWRMDGAREIFAENPKYLYLYVHHNQPVMKPIWIGKDKSICQTLRQHGYRAYYQHSVQGIYYSLRASHTYIGALMPLKNWRLSGGSKVIQLWHGKSVKKTGKNTPYSKGRYNSLLNPHLTARPYRFIGISKFLAQFINSDFNIPESAIVITGAPKYDALISYAKGHEIDIDKNLEAGIEAVKNNQTRRVILYGPTFRPDGSNPLELIDFSSLDKVLRERNDYMLVTMHSKFNNKNWAPNSNLTNVKFITSNGDIYPLLNKIDVLITDYSSLATDFIFMGKPVLFYAPDFEKYEGEMGIYTEIWDKLPDSKAFTMNELMELLRVDTLQLINKVVDSRNVLIGYNDDKACQRIFYALLE